VECRLADAAALEEEGAFDLALVDVPCSGTGTLGRNPEIRHRLQLEDLPRLAERQRDLLRAALRAIRPGGHVVYSTCSLEPEENEQVVAAALSENSNVRQISFAPDLDALRRNGILRPEAAESMRTCLTPDGALRLLPGAAPTDGFFVVLLEKYA
jgi:16S rRNA (cytosine967-C5)-methyltransferase